MRTTRTAGEQTPLAGIRDQRSMPPPAFAPALDGALEPADWYELLKSFVFLWADRERMGRQRRTAGLPQFVITLRCCQLARSIQNGRVSCLPSVAATRGPRLFGAIAIRSLPDLAQAGMAVRPAHVTTGRIPVSLPPAGEGPPSDRCLSGVAKSMLEIHLGSKRRRSLAGYIFERRGWNTPNDRSGFQYC